MDSNPWEGADCDFEALGYSASHLFAGLGSSSAVCLHHVGLMAWPVVATVSEMILTMLVKTEKHQDCSKDLQTVLYGSCTMFTA